MVDSISSSSSSIQQYQQMKKSSPEDMFKQLSTDAGGDGTTISKDQLQSLIDKKSEDGEDTTGLQDMLDNFDSISSDGSSITSSDMDTAMKNGTLQPPGGKKVDGAPSPEDMFKQLSTDAGGDGTTISKDQLQSLIDKKSEDGEDTSALEDMLDNFDEISSDGSSITASDLDTAMKNGVLKKPDEDGNRFNFQDPSTITSSQLESPIDISV